jgi:hypothetical protein
LSDREAVMLAKWDVLPSITIQLNAIARPTNNRALSFLSRNLRPDGPPHQHHLPHARPAPSQLAPVIGHAAPMPITLWEPPCSRQSRSPPSIHLPNLHHLRSSLREANGRRPRVPSS